MAMPLKERMMTCYLMSMQKGRVKDGHRMCNYAGILGRAEAGGLCSKEP